jgi:hypothetical protein
LSLLARRDSDESTEQSRRTTRSACCRARGQINSSLSPRKNNEFRIPSSAAHCPVLESCARIRCSNPVLESGSLESLVKRNDSWLRTPRRLSLSHRFPVSERGVSRQNNNRYADSTSSLPARSTSGAFNALGSFRPYVSTRPRLPPRLIPPSRFVSFCLSARLFSTSTLRPSTAFCIQQRLNIAPAVEIFIIHLNRFQ